MHFSPMPPDMQNAQAGGSPSPGGPYERTPSGRVRRTDLSGTDRAIAVCTHLWWALIPTGVGIVVAAGPLIVWLASRGRNHFLADHGQEATNFIVSLIILHLLLGVTIVGIALWPVLWIVGLIGIVRGAIAAGNGEYYRYPITIRLF